MVMLRKALHSVFLIACLFKLAACANIQPIEFAKPTEERFVEPDTGSIAKRSLGETLISQGFRRYNPAVQLEQTYRTEWIRNSGHRAFEMVFDAGTTLKQVGSFKGTPIYVGPSTGGMVRPDGTQIGAPYGLGVRQDGTVDYVYAAGGVIDETASRQIAARRRIVATEDPDNLKQEFIYSGRTPDTLFFTYREFIGDMARPAFTQNVTYSPNAGNEVAFRSLRLQIIKATNVEIEYRILSGF